MYASKAAAINAVLNRLKEKAGMTEYPAGSNSNEIVQWYNAAVAAIGKGPWCEMTQTWAAWTGLSDGLGKTIKVGRAYTVWAAQDFVDGKLGGKWFWGPEGMQPGDQVYFDWSGRKGSISGIDHTGRSATFWNGATADIWEGNSGNFEGGELRLVRRDAKYIVGYGRPDWSRVVDATVPAKPPIPQLVLTGRLDRATIKRWQQVMGTPVDGVIDATGSSLTKAVQRHLNEKGAKDERGKSLVVDGSGLGSNVNQRFPRTGTTHTIYALQRYLGTTRDGFFSANKSSAIVALQKRLNAGKF